MKKETRGKFQPFSIFNFPFSIEEFGWETGIRTPIGRSRDCSPTIRRSPSVIDNLRAQNHVVKPDFSRALCPIAPLFAS